MCGIEIILAYVKVPQVGLMLQVISRDQLFRTYPLAMRLQHGRRTVGVIGTDVITLVPQQALVTDEDIRLNRLNHVADMQRPIGIGQGAGNQDLSVFIRH